MNVIQWPHRPKRAIIVRETADGLWEGIFRLKGEIMFRAGPGTQQQVVEALVRSWHRCGLPIVIATRQRRRRAG